MFLIDQPFVSDFLVHSIKNNNYKIIATPASRSLVADKSLYWISEEDAIAYLKEHPQTKVYTNSENALSWFDQHLPESQWMSQSRFFKDKVRFRELIRDVFPDFYFQQISLSDIQKLSPGELQFPFVIKPSVGFFSIGVHIVRNPDDWKIARNELKPEKLTSIFPESVLNTTQFIIEEYIEGEEYAVDYYYDENGKVVILNVLHHHFSSGTDTSDRVYSTSKAIIRQHSPGIEKFLNLLGEKLALRNYPSHAEIRIDGNGKIVPIEINPLRFGGWCTSGDLLGVTLGFNSYQCLMEGGKPDWDAVFKGREDKIYSMVVLNNNSGIEADEIVGFDYNSLASDFENPVLVRKFDIKKYGVFGFLFLETSKSNKSELDEILVSDLRMYITANKPG